MSSTSEQAANLPAGQDRTGATHLRDTLKSALAWAQSSTEERLSPSEGKRLRDLFDRSARLAQAAVRPPALGVFGESQVGKSFLIGAFSDSDEGQGSLLIRDPLGRAPGTSLVAGDTVELKGKGEVGGLDFLRHFNAEEGSESTGIVCRFTARSTDVPASAGADVYVARVMSHKDLLISLAYGFLDESKFSGEYVEEMRAALEKIKASSAIKVDADDAQLLALSGAWNTLERLPNHHPYVDALKRVGFSEYLWRGERPAASEDWNRLAGMLWGDCLDPQQGSGLTQIYRSLWEIIERCGQPELMELSSRDVIRCAPSGGTTQKPITSVVVLDGLLLPVPAANERIRVQFSSPGRPATSHELSRAEASGLITELVLPVLADGQGGRGVIAEADILDFPGARAVNPSKDAGAESYSEDIERQHAMAAFRRGKLTRLFEVLSERFEISALCLAAPKENLEAAVLVKRVLFPWIREHQRGRSSDLVADRGLILAITKSDLLLQPRSTGGDEYGHSAFGEAIAQVRRAYTEEDEVEKRWLQPNQWFNGGSFAETHFVFSPKHCPDLEGGDAKVHLQRIKADYLNDEMVRMHVSDPSATWESLVGDGGLQRLQDAVKQSLAEVDRPSRLRRQVQRAASEALDFLRPRYVDPDEAGRYDAAHAAAERATQSILERIEAPDGDRILAQFLKCLTLEEELVESVLDNYDPHGPEIFFDWYWDTLIERWAGRVLTQMDALADAGESLVGLSQALIEVFRQPWIGALMYEALQDYVESLQGPTVHRASLIMTTRWTFNRQLLLLEKASVGAPEVQLPPRLSRIGKQSKYARAGAADASSGAAWKWPVQHWRNHLPKAAGDAAGTAASLPEGNTQLAELLTRLESCALGGAQ